MAPAEHSSLQQREANRQAQAFAFLEGKLADTEKREEDLKQKVRGLHSEVCKLRALNDRLEQQCKRASESDASPPSISQEEPSWHRRCHQDLVFRIGNLDEQLQELKNGQAQAMQRIDCLIDPSQTMQGASDMLEQRLHRQEKATKEAVEAITALTRTICVEVGDHAHRKSEMEAHIRRLENIVSSMAEVIKKQ